MSDLRCDSSHSSRPTVAWSWSGRPPSRTPSQLCQALADGGIRSIELTFTTPDVLPSLREGGRGRQAAPSSASGPCSPRDQARAAIDAGARFLVTPGLRPEVAKVATDAGIPFCLGAMTPTEVALALDLGSSAVKIFPAGPLGPRVPEGPAGALPGCQPAALRRHRCGQRP